MIVKILKYGVLGILLFCNALPLYAQQTGEFFPLSEGSYWIYEGTVKWGEGNDETKSVKLKMEVIRRTINGAFEIAVIKGYPSDLCFYGNGPDEKRGDYLIALKDRKYYLIKIKNDLDGLLTNEALLSSKTGPNNLFLVEPLKNALEFGMKDGKQRKDHMYEWLVNGEESFFNSKSDVKGQKPLTRYTLVYATIPDYQFVKFVPSIGISRFVYIQYGTASEVDVHLTEFFEN